MILISESDQRHIVRLISSHRCFAVVVWLLLASLVRLPMLTWMQSQEAIEEEDMLEEQAYRLR